MKYKRENKMKTWNIRKKSRKIENIKNIAQTKGGKIINKIHWKKNEKSKSWKIKHPPATKNEKKIKIREK